MLRCVHSCTFGQANNAKTIIGTMDVVFGEIDR